MFETPKAVGELLKEAPPALPKRPIWPTVIGVISILLGFPSVASLVICLAYLLVGRGPLMHITELHGSSLAVNAALGTYVFGMSSLLLLGGSGVFQRRPWGRTLLLVYAWVTLGLLAAFAGSWVLSFASGGYADPAHWGQAASKALWPWLPHGLYPLFLILWFRRPRIRAQLSQW
jgi:hypothetical protein